MVIEKRRNTIYHSKACVSLQEYEDKILQVFHEYGYSNRIALPITSKFETFQNYYSDIQLEYLVDFHSGKAKSELYVFVPEYMTILKHLNKTMFCAINDHKLYYIQKTLSWTSVEREFVKEDLVIGCAMLNPVDGMNSWSEMCKVFASTMKEITNSPNIDFKMNHTIEGSIGRTIVGFAKNDNSENKILECHFSLTDIYNVLNK